ncbi:hypothetical protein WJX72_000886 [[Myrmecia] bisecta]|uniref:Phytanoyl-CoA dioxygenase n=1 Tax=[Myrmecia] bisecta TaxID=41462 RepID=A0AAW1Q399_9CHLO
MLDSTQLFKQQQAPELRERLARDGYLLLRQVLNPADVLQARAFLLRELCKAKPACFENTEGKLVHGTRNVGLLHRQDLGKGPLVRKVLESPKLFALMALLYNCQATQIVTTGYKWLRAVAQGEFTGVHSDNVFVGGSPDLLTLWLPLGRVEVEQGALLICSGSHRSRAFAPVRETYGASQVGENGRESGWLTDNGADVATHVGRYGVTWATTNFQPGDVVVLRRDVLHMSATNKWADVRISCDTRWQPADDTRDSRLNEWRCCPEA